MKNTKYNIKNLLALVLATATIIGTSSFGYLRLNSKSEVRLHHVKTDAQFLTSAAEINLEEIQLGKLAQTKSSLMDVQELGKMMQAEHQKSLKDLTALAIKKGISLPQSVTTAAREEYKELTTKSEKKFNEEYCELMIKGHKHAISLFESASKDSVDPEIKAWATSTLPALRAHLEHAKMCKEKCEKM